MDRSPAALALTLALAALAPPASAAGPEEGTPAAKVWQAIRALKHNRPGHPESLSGRGLASQTLEVTEGELNAYLAWEVAREKTKLRSATVRFEKGRIIRVELVAGIDSRYLEQIDGQARTWLEKAVAPLLRGEGRLEVVGFLTSAKGKGFYQTREARVNGARVPDALVREAMELIGPRIKPPVDFNRLFDLPHGIEKAEVLPGSVRVRVRAR